MGGVGASRGRLRCPAAGARPAEGTLRQECDSFRLVRVFHGGSLLWRQARQIPCGAGCRCGDDEAGEGSRVYVRSHVFLLQFPRDAHLFRRRGVYHVCRGSRDSCAEARVFTGSSPCGVHPDGIVRQPVRGEPFGEVADARTDLHSDAVPRQSVADA